MSKIVKQAARSTVFIHSNINIANSKGVLCEHPLKEYPNQTTPKKISTTLPKYFILFMRNNLNFLVALLHIQYCTGIQSQ